MDKLFLRSVRLLFESSVWDKSAVMITLNEWWCPMCQVIIYIFCIAAFVSSSTAAIGLVTTKHIVLSAPVT